MIIELPFNSTPNRSFVSQLGDRNFRFDTRYNDRSNVWTFDLTDEVSGNVLLQSVPLLLGQDLLEPYNLGIGGLLVVDTTNRGREATADTMGDSVKVYWFSPDEIN